jgi:hypothetical protein
LHSLFNLIFPLTPHMASNKAHHATGWAAGLMAAAVVAHSGAGGDYHLGTLLALCMGVCGGTAPDWMEVAWWTRKRRLWIAHRTLTHWGVGWLVLLYWSYHALGQHVMAVPAFGFAAGGLMHLLADSIQDRFYYISIKIKLQTLI